MPIIRYRAPIKLLVAVRGHPFDRNAFDAMLLAMPDISATLVDQPAAAQLMNPTGMAPYDALLLYDMPGLDFEAAANPPASVAPDAALVRGFRALLEQGVGIVALHHALAGWPSWPDYGSWLGGRFLYHPAEVRGRLCLDSGYTCPMAYTAEVLADHPVTRGLPRQFEITDELYMAQIFTAEVEPLLGSRASFTQDRFYSADAAVRGRMHCRDGWDHPPSSNLIGWCKRALRSPLVICSPETGLPHSRTPTIAACSRTPSAG
jgi:hypothetical protein